MTPIGRHRYQNTDSLIIAINFTEKSPEHNTNFGRRKTFDLHLVECKVLTIN